MCASAVACCITYLYQILLSEKETFYILHSFKVHAKRTMSLKYTRHWLLYILTTSSRYKLEKTSVDLRVRDTRTKRHAPVVYNVVSDIRFILWSKSRWHLLEVCDDFQICSFLDSVPRFLAKKTMKNSIASLLPWCVCLHTFTEWLGCGDDGNSSVTPEGRIVSHVCSHDALCLQFLHLSSVFTFIL
jgi:hypothetical protein